MESKRVDFLMILMSKVVLAIACFLFGVVVGVWSMYKFYDWKMRQVVMVGGMVYGGKVYDVRERVIDGR